MRTLRWKLAHLFTAGKTNRIMKNQTIEELGLVKLEYADLQIQGGITIGQIKKIWHVVKKFVEYLYDYKDDFLGGFRDGWYVRNPFGAEGKQC